MPHLPTAPPLLIGGGRVSQPGEYCQWWQPAAWNCWSFVIGNLLGGSSPPAEKKPGSVSRTCSYNSLDP